MILGACQKEDMSPVVDEMSVMNDSVSGSLDTLHLKAGTLTEYPVSPKFGRPNSTYYSFKVYDQSGTIGLCVKLKNKASGAIQYLPMTRSGYYWIKSTKISGNGWYEYTYVYVGSYAPISCNAPLLLCNTLNTFSSTGISSIGWPFGADGSSWSNRTIDGKKWRGGEETKGTQYHYGYGWDEETHKGTREKYSDDWNKGIGNQDLGAIIRSPLDGYIDEIGYDNIDPYGYSLYVAVKQENSDGKFYRFYVSHLDSHPSNLYVGKYVRAGIDQIGTLGSSGASSPHAHTNMRNVTNGANTSVRFYFNAQ